MQFNNYFFALICVNRALKKLTPLKLVCVNAVNNAYLKDAFYGVL